MKARPTQSRQRLTTRRVTQKLRDHNIPMWRPEFSTFSRAYCKYPLLQLDPLYSLPHELLDQLVTHLPGWLTEDELEFERALASLCQRHQAVGVFNGQPVEDPFLLRPATPQLSEAVFRQLNWHKVWTLEKARFLMNVGCERIDPLVERLTAYRGWLVTNPVFQGDLKDLQVRWGAAISELKTIPVYPVRTPPVLRARRPRQSQDVTAEYVQEFNNFFERWELQGMGTWDLPMPRGANLSGEPWPSSIASPPSAVFLQLTPILALPARHRLRATLEEAQRARTPSHLEGWLQVQRQQHAGDLRFLRFERIFLLHFYRDTALASRYRDRFSGNIEVLDRAFGQYLGQLGEESVKKLRLQMASLRRQAD